MCGTGVGNLLAGKEEEKAEKRAQAISTCLGRLVYQSPRHPSLTLYKLLFVFVFGLPFFLHSAILSPASQGSYHSYVGQSCLFNSGTTTTI